MGLAEWHGLDMLEKSRDGFEQRTKPYCALERRLLPIMAARWVFAEGIGIEHGI